MLEKYKHASSLEDLAIWHVYLGSDGMENLMIVIVCVYVGVCVCVMY